MSFRRTALPALAALFVAATAVYAGLWMSMAGRAPTALLGVETVLEDGRVLVTEVRPGSGADRSGLRPGDRLVSLGGTPIGHPDDVFKGIYQQEPGDHLLLTVDRPGAGRVSLQAVLGTRRDRPPPGTSISTRVTQIVLRMYPALFLAGIAAVLLLRSDDPHAWLLAVLFAAFISGAPFFEPLVPYWLRGPSAAYRVFFNVMGPAVFLFLFSVFPTRSPLDRRLPG